jgi:hypothetical protein
MGEPANIDSVKQKQIVYWRDPETRYARAAPNPIPESTDDEARNIA